MERANPAEPVLHFVSSVASGNTSMWQNFTIWTAQQLSHAINISKLAPSLEDLVLAGPRMVMKLGRLGGMRTLPEVFSNFGQYVIAESTQPGLLHNPATITGFDPWQYPQSAPPTAQASAPSTLTDLPRQANNVRVPRFSLESSARGFGAFFSYTTSKWALCCLAVAVIMNRTAVFAAPRRRLQLHWTARLALRILPLVLLVMQARTLLQCIQCQASPEFPALRWGDRNRTDDLMYAVSGSFLHQASSALLLGASDEDSCKAAKMVRWDQAQDVSDMRGSLSTLWPLFLTFSLGNFVEMLSSTVQGLPQVIETGMTLFEHSLAFAEAEADVAHQMGWSVFAKEPTSSDGKAFALTRSMILRRVNTSPEVLLICFLSAMSHITSHVLGILNMQARFRLLSTGFWGLCIMASIAWGLWNLYIDDSLLRYPSVCIIGFVPHIVIVVGILLCCLIYVVGVGLSACALPEAARGEQRGFVPRLIQAHRNMQATTSLPDLRLGMDLDFYTALLRAGFVGITMASEAVYLNEEQRVNVTRYTWLEDERLKELEQLRMEWSGKRQSLLSETWLCDGLGHQSTGFAREKLAVRDLDLAARKTRPQDNIGASERTGRWLTALEYMRHIGRLFLTVCAMMAVRVLRLLRVRGPPEWLRWLTWRPKVGSNRPEQTVSGGPAVRRMEDQGIWPGSSGYLKIRKTDNVDVESELRQRMCVVDKGEDADEPGLYEAEVDSRLYGWWLKGGWWGEVDSSGEYAPANDQLPEEGLDNDDIDATSVISNTETNVTDGDCNAWASDMDDLDDGQHTPTTQFNITRPSCTSSRESTPIVDTPMAMTELARLLHPTSPEESEEAHALAAHLRSDGIVTRSIYRTQERQRRTQILLAGTRRPDVPMSPKEEAQLLEQLLFSRRTAHAGSATVVAEGTSWAGGGPGMGTDGPQCVVCQCSPRTIIVWPCRCLSLCDDCRVSLAMNNFKNCVCCRREVAAFSRIYVP